MRQHLRAAFTAPKYAGISEIADDSSNSGMMPGLAGPCLVSQPIQIGCDPLCAISFMGILINNQANDSSLIFIDRKLKQFMFPFVQLAAPYKFVTVWGNTAAKTSGLYQLAQGGFGTDGGFFAFPVRLPEPDIVGQLIGVIIEPLLPLLGTPNTDAVFNEPFHHKGGLVRNTPDAVEHKNQQNIKPLLFGVFLDNLELVPVFRPHLVTGHTVLLLLVNDRPALFFCKPVAGFPLHGDVRLAPVIVIHLLVGGHTIKTINSVFHYDSTLSNVVTI